MRLLAVGDQDFYDCDIDDKMEAMLEPIHDVNQIVHVTTFYFPGICETAMAWAYDRGISHASYDTSKTPYPMDITATSPLSFLRKIVGDYHINGFFFHFIDNKQQNEDVDRVFRMRIRNMYKQVVKNYKKFPIYTNLEKPFN